MRQVYTDRDEAKQRGLQARADMVKLRFGPFSFAVLL